jgi:Family of unknown function (DUF6364)
MHTKLTLTLDQEIIFLAKDYAKNTGRSLSEMLENYFKKLVSNSNNATNCEDEFESKLKKNTGVVTLPADFDEKKAIQEYLEEKQLK